MIRLLIAVIFILVAIGAIGYLVHLWFAAPHRRLLRQFQKMRELILESIDESQRDHAEMLLEDCEQHLEGLIEARERLDVLAEMADAASEYTRGGRSLDYKELEAKFQRDVDYFLGEMARISSEVGYDWRQSIKQLEVFTDELEEQREVFDGLEQFSEENVEFSDEEVELSDEQVELSDEQVERSDDR